VNIKWQDGTPTPVKGVYHTAVLCDGKVYIGGGSDSEGPSYRIDVYTPANNSWSSSPYQHYLLLLCHDHPQQPVDHCWREG